MSGANVTATQHNAWIHSKDQVTSLRMAGALQEALTLAELCVEEAVLWERKDLEAAALCERGMVLEAMGKHLHAISCFEQQIALSNQRGDEESVLIARFNLGTSLLSIQRASEACQNFMELLTFALSKGHKQFEIAARGNLAMALQAQGKFEDAEEHLEHALQTCEQLGDLHVKARILGTLGNQLYDTEKYELAMSKFQDLVELAHSIEDPVTEGSASGQLGLVFAQLHRPADAKQMHERQLDIAVRCKLLKQELASRTNLAGLHEASGDFDLAIAEVERCVQICEDAGSPARLCQAQHDLGTLHWRSARHAAALKLIGTAKQTAIELGVDAPALLLYMLSLGEVYMSLGQTKRAIKEFAEAVAVADSLEDLRAQRKACGSLGLAFLSVAEYRRAIRWLSRSLPADEAAWQHGDNANALCNLGNAYARLGEFEKAEALFRQHLAIAQQSPARGPHETAVLYGGLGVLYSLQGRWDAAIECCETEVRLARGGADRASLARARNNLGFALLRAGAPARAEAALLAAVRGLEEQEAGLPDEDDLRVSLFEIARHSYELLQLALVALGQPALAFAAAERSKARSFNAAVTAAASGVMPPSGEASRVGEEEDGEDEEGVLAEDWEELRAAVRREGCPVLEYSICDAETLLVWVALPDGGEPRCVQVRLEKDGGTAGEDLRTLVQMTRASMGVQGRSRQLEQARGLQAEGEAPAAATADSERVSGGSGVAREAGHRARLLELYVDNALRDGAAASYAEEDEGQEAESSEREWELAMLEEIHRDPELLAEMKAGLEEHRAVLAWWSRLCEEAPGRRGWDAEQTNRWRESVAQLQRRRRAWAWGSVAELAGGVLARELGVMDGAHRQEVLGAAREAMDAERLLRRLHAMLLPPEVDEELRSAEPERLLVVPHQQLSAVPWAALLDAQGCFLVERAAIRLAPSLRAAALLRQRQQHGASAQRPPRTAVVGNPCGTLPFAEEEARVVAAELEKVFGEGEGREKSVQLALQNEATPVHVEGMMEGAAWVHLACHGLLEDRSLVLAAPGEGAHAEGEAATSPRDPLTAVPRPEGGGRESEGGGRGSEGGGRGSSQHLLRMERVQGRLQLAAGSTVVLSACNTGLGQVLGEGVVGLSRAFLLAGASATVASLWSVPDRSTRELMQTLYSRLRDGASLEEALRLAMLRMLGRQPSSWRSRGAAAAGGARSGAVQPEQRETVTRRGAPAPDAASEGEEGGASRGRIGLSKSASESGWTRPVHWAGFVVVGGQTILRAASTG